ncbi:tail fiber assembly protein [Jejubacter calystegiae]|uniref:Tail fiber assembly protein n=1 Tax=Jejubacter calystegiae TaxID=2579935 RepID=A0A4P8YNH1_9ENTR|nr:tail fiber assembly protein [Jejubacter calystegiae]
MVRLCGILTLLNRVDTSKAPDMEWPQPPT